MLLACFFDRLTKPDVHDGCFRLVVTVSSGLLDVDRLVETIALKELNDVHSV